MNSIVIGQRLKALREKKGVTIYAVAKSCGITAAAVCMYEAGKRVPRDAVKIKLANYYKKTVEYVEYVRSIKYHEEKKTWWKRLLAVFKS